MASNGDPSNPPVPTYRELADRLGRQDQERSIRFQREILGTFSPGTMREHIREFVRRLPLSDDGRTAREMLIDRLEVLATDYDMLDERTRGMRENLDALNRRVTELTMTRPPPPLLIGEVHAVRVADGSELQAVQQIGSMAPIYISGRATGQARIERTQLSGAEIESRMRIQQEFALVEQAMLNSLGVPAEFLGINNEDKQQNDEDELDELFANIDVELPTGRFIDLEG